MFAITAAWVSLVAIPGALPWASTDDSQRVGPLADALHENLSLRWMALRPTEAKSAAGAGFEIANDASLTVTGNNAPTDVYVPRIQYPDGAVIEASGGAVELDADAQRLLWHHAGGGAQTLRVTRA